MNWFVDDPSALIPVVAGSRSRAVGAGVDPFQYEEIATGLPNLRSWLPGFAAAAREHAQAAQDAEALGRTASAQTSWRSAAACWHVATTLPHPDTAAVHEAAHEASTALSHYLRLRGDTTALVPGARAEPFTGELRLPHTYPGQAAPVAIIIAGLDSARVEFLDLADVLLARGVAVAAIDGPGQGALIDTAPNPQYQRVVSSVLDSLTTHLTVDPARVAVVGLSLGGLYALLAAANDPRITAIATVSGPYPFPRWEDLPPFATDTLRLRTGTHAAATQVAEQLHNAALAPGVSQPLLVVSGTADVLPSPEQARAMSDAAPCARLMLVPGGDHLYGNARWRWMDTLADWTGDQVHHRVSTTG